ncbi:MAG TPA: hypothetical protein VMX13_02795 [Sedimentisphaerales bacterium]|nr:hypothetical protein [Sedimentisphaerales bacterium]
MARNRGKKALYEVIGKGNLRKPAPGPVVVPPPPPLEEPSADEPAVESPAEQQPAGTTWPKRPAIVQVNAGRIEFSLPYQVAVALLLGLLLLVLVVYRLGQMSYSSEPMDQAPVAGGKETGKTEPPPRTVPPRTVPPPSRVEMTPPVEVGGKNAIIIVEYDKERDLRPVQEHFGKFGIETEIVPAPRGRYYLRTKERYESFAPGTKGERDLNSVKRAGALYKADPGYERFGTKRTKPFQDAYGRKVD